MGISNFVPNSRISQAGVVADTADRPASPYEGQVLYQRDTNQLLVWDGSAWVMIADTDQPPGLQLIKTQTVGASKTSEAVTDVFSSEFDNYRIIYSGYTTSLSEPLKMRLGSQTTGYYGSFQYSTYVGTGVSTVQDSNEGYFRYVGGGNTSDAGSVCMIDVFNPNKAENTTVRAYSVLYSTIVNGTYGGVVFNTTQFTGFTLFQFSTGTFSNGTIRVYGYRN